MEYQKIINLLYNTPSQPYKFRTKNWVEINDDSRGNYNPNSQIKFKILMLKSSLYDYSDVYKVVKGTISVAETGFNKVVAGEDPNKNNKEVVFKNYAALTDCWSEINNAQIVNAKDISLLMSMYNLIEYSGNYLKKSETLWQYYRDEPSLNWFRCYRLFSW